LGQGKKGRKRKLFGGVGKGFFFFFGKPQPGKKRFLFLANGKISGLGQQGQWQKAERNGPKVPEKPWFHWFDLPEKFFFVFVGQSLNGGVETPVLPCWRGGIARVGPEDGDQGPVL